MFYFNVCVYTLSILYMWMITSRFKLVYKNIQNMEFIYIISSQNVMILDY